MKNKVNKPSLFNKSSLFNDILDKWQLVETLSGGTDAMREAGELYLKKNPKENIVKYRDRLSRATLTNKYARTIEKGVGKAFARKMNVVLPTSMEPMLYNVDGQGTSFESFTKGVLHDAINYGITYILVDYPETTAQTLAEQRNENAFPYFININPTQVLDFRVDYIGNTLQLTYFRYYESVAEFSDLYLQNEVVEQVREYRLSDAGVEYSVVRKSKELGEHVVASGVMSVDRIPIVPIYGKKTQAYMGEPVLMELAHLNAKHWWKQSDLDWNEHYGLTPILGLMGISNQVDPTTGKQSIEDFTVGASTVVNLGENGGLSWTNADSAGIKAAQDSLDRLLKEMDEAGLELTTRQQGGVETATGAILDAAEANSILKGIVVDLNWQMYQAVLLAGQYMGIDATDANVAVDTQYTVTQAANTTDIQLWLQMYKEKVITLEELRNELQSRKIAVSESVDEGFSNIPAGLSNVAVVQEITNLGEGAV